jgi:hypothetical protein
MSLAGANWRLQEVSREWISEVWRFAHSNRQPLNHKGYAILDHLSNNNTTHHLKITVFLHYTHSELLVDPTPRSNNSSARGLGSQKKYRIEAIHIQTIALCPILDSLPSPLTSLCVMPRIIPKHERPQANVDLISKLSQLTHLDIFTRYHKRNIDICLVYITYPWRSLIRLRFTWSSEDVLQAPGSMRAVRIYELSEAWPNKPSVELLHDITDVNARIKIHESFSIDICIWFFVPFWPVAWLTSVLIRVMCKSIPIESFVRLVVHTRHFLSCVALNVKKIRTSPEHEA